MVAAARQEKLTSTAIAIAAASVHAKQVKKAVEKTRAQKTKAAKEQAQRSKGSPPVRTIQVFTGGDVSWPNCAKGTPMAGHKAIGNPMPAASASFVVIGLNNGRGFDPNSCVVSQLVWAKDHHTLTAPYTFMTLPTPAQVAMYGRSGPFSGTGREAKLRNAGYAQAKANVDTMKRVGFAAKFIWIDIEYSHKTPWSATKAYNRAALDGTLRAYREAGLKFGFYASIEPWQTIFGSVRYSAPEWRSSGPVDQTAALSKCQTKSTQGGRVVLSQWWNARSDLDVICPDFRTTKQLRRYFHQY